MFTRIIVGRFYASDGILSRSILLLLLGLGSQQTAIGSPSALNQTQNNQATTIGIACPQGTPINNVDFQNRCNALVTASGVPPANLPSTTDPGTIGALNQISPEQTIAPGTQTTKTGAASLNMAAGAINTRIQTVRMGLNGKEFAGIQLFRNGELLTEDGYTGLQPSQSSGGAAGDDFFSRLGFWAHGIYNFGSVDSSFDAIGFQFDNWGMTTGVDYRVTDDVILGAAFSYMGSDADFAKSGGGLESDSYTGSIYGSYYVMDNLYIDGIASYGGIEYDIDRNIRYSVGGALAETVNATAKGSPDGEQYSFGLGAGYDMNMGALTVTPYTRFNYTAGQLDSYNESGGAGWAQSFSEQNFRSLTSTLGSQLVYAISIPWGVLTTQAHGEWLHEFKDSQRKYSTFFRGDGIQNAFNVVTTSPDRNYFVFGVGFTGTFAHGISTYINYDTLIDYNNISSHRIMLGGRMEF